MPACSSNSSMLRRSSTSKKKWRRCWTSCRPRDPTRCRDGVRPRTSRRGGRDGGLSRVGHAAQQLLSSPASSCGTLPAPVASTASPCADAGRAGGRAAQLNSERFADRAPRAIYATLLDEGIRLCHWRTMYRLLRVDAATCERRAIRRHPVYTRPELLATAPRQVWSWDITKLRGPQPGVWYNLYVVIDIFSRMIVGWMVAAREDASLAEILIADACTREGIAPQQLTVHADRGAPMTSKLVAESLLDLGVTRSHSRPSVSNDNPYSEAQFKTMKYGPSYPERFASLEKAQAWVASFIP